MADPKSPKGPPAKPAPALDPKRPAPRPTGSASGAAKGGKKGAPDERVMNIPQPRERRKPYHPLKIVERKPNTPDGKTWLQRLRDEPERIGYFFAERPAWFDEAGAVILIVIGFITLFTLIAASPGAAIAGQWAENIRQLFGSTGGIMIAVMIMALGVLLILPNLGIEIPFLLPRIAWVEIAFIALLAVLHINARDPEPRALARSGAGGGYIGWAVSQAFISVLGSNLSLGFLAAIIVFALGMAVGVRRRHIRAVVSSIATLLIGVADRLRQIRLPSLPKLTFTLGRGNGQPAHVRRAAHLAELDSAPSAPQLADSREPDRPAALSAASLVSESGSRLPRLRTGQPGSPFTPQPIPSPAVPSATAPSPATNKPAAAAPPSASPPLRLAGTAAPAAPTLAPSVATSGTPAAPSIVASAAAQPASRPPAIVRPGLVSASAANEEADLPPMPALKPIALRPAGTGAMQEDDLSELEPPTLIAPPKPSVPIRSAPVSTPTSTPVSKPVSTPTSSTAASSKAVSSAQRQRSKPMLQPVDRVPRTFTVSAFRENRIELKRAGTPPINLLSETELNRPTEAEINQNARVIENTLLEFDIDVEVVDVNVGPTITQYAVQPFREYTDEEGHITTQRVRVTKIAGLADDLALALSAKRLRIQPFVPGQRYMGIEVPNRASSTVAMRPVMESENFANAFVKPDSETGQLRERPLVVPLGRDVSGEAVAVDLAMMPHLLVAGTTGSGKSVCLTAMITALIMNNTPERVRLVMLDPKMVELIRFNGVPHLLGPVETDGERIIGVLRWATREMERRYKLLEQASARNIEIYNRAIPPENKTQRLPYIAIFVDEIGDLMLSRPDETERTVTRLAQMARAVGMHMVIATQRPSVDVITGLIKANFPSRISFAVASGIDSRVILDAPGAETLLGRGDMLYLAADAGQPRRVQGCYLSDEEIDEVVKWWRDWESGQPDDQQVKLRDDWSPWERGMTRRESLATNEPLLEETIALVIKEGAASTSIIQRGLNIPYPRAANLMDLLNVLGVLGPSRDSGRTRDVLIKPGTDPYKRLLNRIRKA